MKIMENTTTDMNIDDETIRKIGLRLSDKAINAQISPEARVFEYPHLENVFIMESDLYGNKMPKDSCFLAFKGVHGLIGKHLKVETLKNATAEDIKNIVESNQEG
jgi:hypothetical protein